MPLNNVVKKFEKSRKAAGLSSDEEILAACMINPKAVGAAAVGGLAGVAVQSALQKRKAASAPSDGAMASPMPTHRCLMAITSQQVVVCSMSAMSGKPKGIVAAWPNSIITSFTVEKGVTGYPFQISFSDGSVAQSEGAKGSGADQLGDATSRLWP